LHIGGGDYTPEGSKWNTFDEKPPVGKQIIVWRKDKNDSILIKVMESDCFFLSERKGNLWLPVIGPKEEK
jgi:hypothetical protein